MIAATGNQSHSKDLISMNRKFLNVVAIASLILPIRIAAADSLNAGANCRKPQYAAIFRASDQLARSRLLSK
jgi:hypothetical protein